MKTLKNRLKNGIENFYLVEGDDYFLFDKALSMIKNASQIQLEEFNISKFDDDNFSGKAVVDSTQVLPLSSEKRIVVVKDVTKVSENDIKQLKSYLENPVESTVLVILDSADKFSSLKGYGQFVDAKRMDRNLASAVIVNALAKQGKQISGEALATLLDYCNGYLTRVMNELDKLVFYDVTNPLITKDLVEKLVHKDTDFVVFELTEALGKRDVSKAIKLLSAMVKEQGTLGLITNHFRRLFFISISDLDNARLAQTLGVKEYAIVKQREQLHNFSKMQLKKIYALLEEVDYKIKSGQMLSENALYFLVFSILYTI